MSTLNIHEEGGEWTARIEACPSTPVTRTDLWVSLGLYGLSSAVLGYLGFALGAAASSVAGGGPVLAVVGGALPLLWLAWHLGIELVHRSLVYDLSSEGDSVRIRVSRQGVGRFVPIPLQWTGAVQLPEPWPAAVDGTLHDFRVIRAALRGVQLHPYAIGLLLSADRAIFLSIRGHTEEDLQPMADRLER